MNRIWGQRIPSADAVPVRM